MKFLFFLLFVSSCALTSGRAQVTPPQSNLVITSGNGVDILTWESVTGRTYFIEYSFDLQNWTYLPEIFAEVRVGNDLSISEWIYSSTEEIFFRMQCTDDAATNSDPFGGDYDGDGYSNWMELLSGTDPLVFNKGPANPGGAQAPDYPDYPVPPPLLGYVAYYLNVDVVGTEANNPSPPRRLQYALNSEFDILALNGSESDLLPTGWLYDWPVYLEVRNVEIKIQLVAVEDENTVRKFTFLKHEESFPENATEDLVTLTPFDLSILANQTTSDTETITQDLPGTEPDRVIYPVVLMQKNFPAFGGINSATDLDTLFKSKIIGKGSNSYVTGKPTAPKLRSEVKGFPGEVEWKLTIRTERPLLRATLDNRDIPEQGWTSLSGGQAWNIESAIDELIGGNCNLSYQATIQNGGNNVSSNGTLQFFVRGKNPLDDDARAYVDITVGADFTDYAWGMVKSESRLLSTIYNQFNTQSSIEGTLNFGAPDGWGIAQIDRRSEREIPDITPKQYYAPDHPGLTATQYTTTAETWNWHVNINAMQQKLVQKRTTHITFINRFRNAYGGNSNWVEPPEAHTVGATTLPAEAWGVMVLYNGVRGVPSTTVPGHNGSFRSPWVFSPATGEWDFHDNDQSYATARVRPELEETINSEE